jgi:cation diffusion facilitator family transporter
MASNTSTNQNDVRLQQFAMRLSLAIGLLMFAGKFYAYWLTNSAAILSDAAESVVHVVAVCFATYSLWLSLKPPDRSHLYGHDRISFFSAGFEGAMIVIAACYILFVSIQKIFSSPAIDNLGTGTLLILLASLINGALGGFLVWVGRTRNSLILEANGKHVLTDCYTSFGVVGGLCLALLTGWLYFDPILAILVALNILWSGGMLVRRSIGGLMDEVDPHLETDLRRTLDRMTSTLGIQYHGLRYRKAGNKVWVEFHLLFARGESLDNAHLIATQIEEELEKELPAKTEVLTHLEPLEDHHSAHAHGHFEQMP